MIGHEEEMKREEECQLQVSESAEEAKIWFVRLKVISSSISLFLRLMASFVVAAYEGWIRRRYTILSTLKDRLKYQIRSLLTSNFTSSLTGIIVYRGKIQSVFHVFSIVNLRPRIKWGRVERAPGLHLTEPEKSVNCIVLHSPETEEEIRADVIFIHGLHGSVVHTWKQGLWSYRKRVENCPLEHKYKLEATAADTVATTKTTVEKAAGRSRRRTRSSTSSSEEDRDVVLENITDIINNIDDRIKETTTKGSGAVPEVEPYSPCWPRDWLPKDCPGIRVIAVNYTTDPFLWRPAWITKRIRTSMTQRSEEMEDHLLKLGVGRNPIVWVGHSKGGLFVKQMLVDADNSDEPSLKRFLHQTKAIMFYSVPHRGSSLAHINLPFLRQSIELTEVKKAFKLCMRQMCSTFKPDEDDPQLHGLGRISTFIHHFNSHCKEVLNLHCQFTKLYERNVLTAEVYSFVETVLTFMFITNVRVVSVDSADVGFGVFRGVNIDHREICKPLNRDCFLYKELANLINRVV